MANDRDKQREFLALVDAVGPLPAGMLAQSTLAPPCAWCTPEERAAHMPCVCTAELTDAVVNLCREIASVAPLEMLVRCHLKREITGEAPDGA